MSTKHTPMIVAAARAMCKLESEGCGVDNDDLWKTYGDEFLKDAEKVVEATGAPDLLEALEGLMEVERRGRFMPIGREWDAARAAIARATGAKP